MKQIALTIQQMKRLQELDVDISSASMCWINGEVLVLCDKTVQQTFYNANISFPNDNKYDPAFTLQDIFELLQIKIREYKLVNDCHNYIAYVDYVASDDEEDGTNKYVVEEDILHAVFCKEIIIAAYEMLCWCAENGYLKGGKP